MSELIQHLVNTSVDGMLVIDQSQTIVFVNSYCGLLFDYDPCDLVGQPLDILIPESIRSKHQEHVHSFAQRSIGENYRMGGEHQIFGQKSSGETFPIDVSLSTFFFMDRLILVQLSGM